ncbi:MAG: SIS domain-containing protein [Gemmatimonadetes bacterium]|nr:SIS domain-containing protein [Gemmatimonadota bacterium]
MSYVDQYLEEVGRILQRLDIRALESMVDGLVQVREEGGRLFFLGVGGGAGHASHAANDFRKVAGLECYAPTDNVAELTARINDDGWDSSFVGYLRGSRLRPADAVFVFSVGGGSLERNVSPNIVKALTFAKQVGARVFGIVGRDGGFTARVADHCVVVPTSSSDGVTPHTEGMQAVIWHLLVSHPRLKRYAMKWETVEGREATPAEPRE